MSSSDPTLPSPRVAAALDIGSNTIKLTVAELRDGRVEQLFARSDTVRLSLDLDRTGRMADDRVEAAMAALTLFVEMAREAGADPIVAVATEAMRVATNGPEVRSRIERELGISVELISGDREADLTFLGVMAAADPAGDLVLADVGGASTELIVATDGVRRFSRSVPVGSGRMTDRHVRTDPPTPAELAGVRADVVEAVGALDMPSVPGARMLIVGGTGEFLFRLAPAGTLSADRDELEAMVAHLTTIPALDLTTLITIPEARARVLPAGATIALGIADVVGPRSVAAGPSGIRMGLLMELARGVRA